VKGCLALIVLFFALAIAEYFALRYTPLSGSYGLPLVSAATVSISIASLWGMLTALTRKRALGVPPDRWTDGDFVGFSGRIVSEGSPLAAPASGEASAIYEYELKCSRQSGDDEVNVTAVQGMGMAGCRVESGANAFRLIGFPILAQVPKSRLDDLGSLERIAAHLLRSDVRPKPENIAATLRSLGEVLADADGIVHFDQHAHLDLDLGPYKERQAADPQAAAAELGAFLEGDAFFVDETLIRDGAEVTVFGAFRGAARAIDIGSGLQNVSRGLSLGAPGGAGSRAELVRAAVTCVVVLAITAALHRWMVPPLRASATTERYHGDPIGFDEAIGAVFGSQDARSKLVTLAQSDDASAIILLTRLGADPDGAGSDPRPLQQAGSTATAKALLDAGADPNFRGHQGNSPLHYATERGNLKTVRLLLAHRARVDLVDDWGNTPLARAAVYGHLDIGRALLDAHADPNHRAKDGSAPLDEARANGNTEFVELLLSHGATETEVSAKTGHPVSLEDPPVRLAQAYEDALRAQDTETIAVLNPSMRGYDWSTTDWDAMLSGRPVRFVQARGFIAPDRATIRVGGPTADGGRGLTIGFALARDGSAVSAHRLARYDGWHIEREWIEWGELKAKR
jgi:hypothetical protein